MIGVRRVTTKTQRHKGNLCLISPCSPTHTIQRRAKKIDFILAPALETMEEFINQDKIFDLVFIDADKKNYKNYFLKSLELLEKDGIIIVDNTLWKGKVADLNISDDQTNSIREFNRFVKDFKGIESMILPIADGMTICRKL